ncbi:MAG: hypothetical protein LUC35_09240 [Clostridiales bacterium]|nr:hypothetical protein [Clostridiales bacterium]
MMKLRAVVLLTAFCLALSLSCAALSSPWPQAAETAASTVVVSAASRRPHRGGGPSL